MAEDLKAIDASVAGEHVRLLVEGGLTVSGDTMDDKRAWLQANADFLRRSLLEHGDHCTGMHGALFTEPASPKTHAGMLFMNPVGFPRISGEALMAAATIAIDHRIIHVSADELYLDTPAGVLTATPSLGMRAKGGVGGMQLTGLAGFVQDAGVDVEFDGRTVSVDVAFGGEFFAVVDADSIGLPVIQESAFDLVRAAERLLPAVDRVVQRRRPGLSLMHGAIFTDSLRSPDYVRSATVLGGGLLLRSPGAASTIALMALWESRGSLTDRTFIHESAFGTLLYGTVFARQVVEGRRIIVPTIESPVAMIGSCVLGRGEWPVRSE